MQTASIHIDKIRITAQWTHKPTGKPHYFDEEDFGLLPSGSATANQKTLIDGGKEAYIKSKGIDEFGMAHLIEIHCCPPLVLQKHNLFGHCVLQDYVYTILDLAAKRLDLAVDPAQRAEWKRGDVAITEIHLTANFRCPQTAVLAIIEAIDADVSEGKWRPEPTSITVHKATERRSKSHALTVYDKAVQMAAAFRSANKGKQPGKFQSLLIQEARKGIRAEVKLHSEELKYLDLGVVSCWAGVNVTELYFKFLNKYRIGHCIQRLLTDDELEVLSKSERKVYLLWLGGVKLEDHYSRSTVWKYATLIKSKVDIDIRGDRRPEKLPPVETSAIFVPENVLPVPEWAIGTEYYFPPRPVDLPKYSRGICGLQIPPDEDED